MDLMIALFIGFVIICRICAESHRGHVYARHDNAAANEVSDFYNKYGATEEQVDEAKAKVRQRVPAVIRLEETLTEVIGRKPTEPMLVWGLLAKKGKVLVLKGDKFYNRENVLAITQNWGWSGWQGSTDKKGTAMLEQARLKYLKWLDKELAGAGMHERLKYIPPSPGLKNTYKFVYRPRDAKPISECSDLSFGIVIWLPVAHFFGAYLPENKENIFKYDPAWWSF